jgi:putative ABC transport system permease protein
MSFVEGAAAMWRNYMTVGIRALVKNKTYAFINVFGLAVGLAACLILLIYVRYETSYDAWLPDAADSYQLQLSNTNQQTGEVTHLQMTSYTSGQHFRAAFPQVEHSVYVWSNQAVVLRDGEALSVDGALLVDDRFFDVLRFPFAEGDPRTALARAGSAVLTEREARRLFGTPHAMGRTLTMMQDGRPVDYRVTGIARDLPHNSHVDFSMLLRIDPAAIFASTPQILTHWGWQSGWFYFTVRPGTNIAAMQARIPDWKRRNIPDEQFGNRTTNQGDTQNYQIVNIRDVHLSGATIGAMTPINDHRTIATFAIIAFLILGMACVNFTNLATARAGQRAREVALRKVLGATRRQLVTQFLAESILIAGIAMLLALALAELALPALSNFLDADLAMHYFGRGGMLLPILALVVVVGAAGGVYPAFYLSRFQPARVLKANKSSAEAAGSGALRNILVVAQFAVSIGLIICTIVVYAQTVYARTVDPGYRRDGLIQIQGVGRRQFVEHGDSVIAAIRRVPGVVSVARSTIGVSTGQTLSSGIAVPGHADPIDIGTYTVDPAFFRTMGIERVAGRLFDESRPADDLDQPFVATPEAQRALVARGANVVINELAARRLGFARPADAVGQTVRGGFVESAYGLVPVRIIGVVRDSRFRSIRLPIEPIMFAWDERSATTLLVRHDGTDPNGTRERIERIWKRMMPQIPFEAQFSEARNAKLYSADEARAKVFAGFAALAVLVAALGLFGLAAFTAERRTKEIGIRKVLGARTRDVVRLLAWQFSKPVILANLIAWPLAWWAMRNWLNTFDTRIDLGPLPFLLAGAAALIIAIGTIAGHAFKVARANPIHALRYE